MTHQRSARSDAASSGARGSPDFITLVACAGAAILAALVIGAVVAACGTGAGSTTTTFRPTSTTEPAPTTITTGGSTTLAQGIEGTVTIGPISPVSRPGEENSRPYVATLVVRASPGNQVVAAVTSAADGTFRVGLPPGEYVVEPQESSPYPVAEPQEVTVSPGEYTIIVVAYDSGIR